jgi:hypothetical protein
MTSGICFESMRKRVNWTHVTRVLARKCAHRQVGILSITDVFEPSLLEEVRSSWEVPWVHSCAGFPNVDLLLPETRARLEACRSSRRLRAECSSRNQRYPPCPLPSLPAPGPSFGVRWSSGVSEFRLSGRGPSSDALDSLPSFLLLPFSHPPWSATTGVSH